MNYSKGILLKLLNITLFSLVSVLFTIFDGKIHIFHYMFFSSLIAAAMLCFSIYIAAIDFSHKLYNRGHFFYYLGRAGFNVLAMCAWLEAIRQIGPNTSSAISYMTPIFTWILAMLVFKERFNVWCAMAIGVSFTGLYLILNPSHEMLISDGGLMALAASIAWALHDILCKMHSSKEHCIIQAMWVFAFSAILTLPFVFNIENNFESDDMTLLVLLSFFSALNVVVLFLSYRAAPLSVLMPFSYCRFIMVSLLAYFILHHTVEVNTLYGIFLIIAASSVIFYQQRKGKIKI